MALNKIRFSPWKKAGIVMLIIFLLLAFYLGINYLAYLCPLRIDVTKFKQHTLNKGTIEFIQKLPKDVKLTALYTGLPPKYLEDMFNEYGRISQGKIKTEIIDPIEQIGYAAQFGNIINKNERKVVVQSEKERRDIDFTNEPLSEEHLTNSIVRVTRDARKVYFLTGHGEYNIFNKGETGLIRLVDLLKSNNIQSDNLMLGIEEEIPKDCDVLIIAGPQQELTKKEEILIEEYLINGGDALFLIEHVIVTTPDKPLTEEEIQKNPSLNNLLNPWGIHVGKNIVVDLSSHAGSDVGSPATKNYIKHKAITEDLDYTFYVRPRSITSLRNRRPTIKTAPIVLTAAKGNSFVEHDRTLSIKFDEDIDIKGPVPMAFVAMEPKEEGDHSDTRLIVFTDADFLTNVYINHYSNADMGLNIINWLSELDYQVFLDPKDIKVEQLDLTSQQKRIIITILSLMPLLIAISGILVWLKSRIDVKAGN